MWAGGVHVMHPPRTMRYGRSMRGRYASYWNAFLYTAIFAFGNVILVLLFYTRVNEPLWCISAQTNPENMLLEMK